MSSTNGTINPFAADTTGSQAGLYKGIGVSLAVASGKKKTYKKTIYMVKLIPLLKVFSLVAVLFLKRRDYYNQLNSLVI